MNTATKVAAFGAGLAALFAAALGLGTLIGPVGSGGTGVPAQPSGHSTEPRGDHGSDHGGEAGGSQQAKAELPGGLLVAQDGYRLELDQRALSATKDLTLRFRILGPDGRPVTDYTAGHGKQLHLIVVRRDLTGFQHVHPQLDAAGSWTVPLDLSAPGDYRVFADFIPADRGAGLTLGADLFVAGDYQPHQLPKPSRTAEVDGYTVTLDGTLTAGEETELTLSVSRGGQPVTDLQPYLEAYGHLVALRDRDLAYLHVHPTGTPGEGTTPAGPANRFRATAPSAGAYRLFLDFRHADRVHTAEFTVIVGDSAGQPQLPAPDATPKGEQ